MSRKPASRADLQDQFRSKTSSSPDENEAVNWGEERGRRREMILDLVEQGLTPAAMAKIFGVHPNTIFNDFRWIRKNASKLVTNFDQQGELGEHLLQWRRMERKLLEQATACPDGSRPKATFLSLAMQARSQAQELQLRTGLIPTVEQRHVHELYEMGPEGQDIRTMRPSDLQKLAATMLLKIKGSPKLQKALPQLLRALPKDEPQIVVENGAQSESPPSEPAPGAGARSRDQDQDPGADSESEDAA